MTSGFNQAGASLAWPQNGAAWIERELCIEPQNIPVEYTLVEKSDPCDGQDIEWSFAMTVDAVVLRRTSPKVSHLPREIPFSDFSDVVLWGALAFNETGDVMVGLSLYSKRYDLQIPVCITADTEGLAARWTEWSAALGLCPKVLDGLQDLRDPFQGIDKLVAGSAQPRRMATSRLAHRALPDGCNVHRLKQGGERNPAPQPH